MCCVRASVAGVADNEAESCVAAHQAGYFFENSERSSAIRGLSHARQRDRLILKPQVAQNPPCQVYFRSEELRKRAVASTPTADVSVERADAARG